MRRNRLPGTRNPLSCPESKQRMMVCWLTLQILAASPVVNTVFIWQLTLSLAALEASLSGTRSLAVLSTKKPWGT